MQTLFRAHYVKYGIHKWCSGVRGDLSQVADGFRCRRSDGTIKEAPNDTAPNDTAYRRFSCQSGLANPVQIMSTHPAPSNGDPITVF